MALHHKTLEAAINKYSTLIEAGKSEEEVKAELAKDEKKFEEADINEIYAKLTEKPAAYKVVSFFRDKNNWSIAYNVDDDVSHFDEERLKDCIEKGLVEKQ